MKWFKNWFYRMSQEAWEQARAEEKPRDIDHQIRKASTIKEIAMNRGNTFDRQATFNFKMHTAENGHVIEVQHFDERTDRYGIRLYLIGDEEEFEKSLGHIITVEGLRK